MRGTRPANRRQLILEAAARLFAERGYEHVSVVDIADEVAVGPSALYRHFKGKEQILAEVIGMVAEEFTAFCRAGAGVHGVVQSAAEFVLANREVGVLWQREVRRLPPTVHREVVRQIRAARCAFVAAVCSVGADRTAPAAALSAVLSPSFHHAEMPRPMYADHLAGIAERVLKIDLPSAVQRAEPRPGLRRSSTREGLVCTAVELFAERTYSSVGIEDIAAASGMAPSSLYNHFASKSELLVTALTRADGFLQVTLDRILARSADARSALFELVEAYVSFAVENPALIDALVTEVRNLPEGPAAVMRQSQRSYVGEWSQLVRDVHTEIDAQAARVSVHAGLMMINDLVRTPDIRDRSDVRDVLARLTRAVLDI